MPLTPTVSPRNLPIVSHPPRQLLPPGIAQPCSIRRPSSSSLPCSWPPLPPSPPRVASQLLSLLTKNSEARASRSISAGSWLQEVCCFSLLVQPCLQASDPPWPPRRSPRRHCQGTAPSHQKAAAASSQGHPIPPSRPTRSARAWPVWQAPHQWRPRRSRSVRDRAARTSLTCRDAQLGAPSRS